MFTYLHHKIICLKHLSRHTIRFPLFPVEVLFACTVTINCSLKKIVFLLLIKENKQTKRNPQGVNLRILSVGELLVIDQMTTQTFTARFNFCVSICPHCNLEILKGSEEDRTISETYFTSAKHQCPARTLHGIFSENIHSRPCRSFTDIWYKDCEVSPVLKVSPVSLSALSL